MKDTMADFMKLLDKDISNYTTKVNLSESTKIEEAKTLAEKYDCRLYSYRGEDLYGFASGKSGKYQAVLALGEIIHIGLDEMIAFGDDENDYEILQNAGKGVAVENAIPTIRKIADDITESNNDDGVAKYIEKELKIYGNI